MKRAAGGRRDVSCNSWSRTDARRRHRDSKQRRERPVAAWTHRPTWSQIFDPYTISCSVWNFARPLLPFNAAPTFKRRYS